MLVGFAESRRSRREHRIEDLGALGSRFSPSVSVVLAAHNEEVALPHAVRSLLGLDYAEFEVIVVNDGSTDDTLEKLRRTLDLVPVEASSRGLIETEQIVAYYRSSSDPRLLVIDKVNGGKADALNAGLNHSRCRYVCGVDADMVFASDALSRAMRVITQDPKTIVGLTSFVEVVEDPSRALVGGADYDIPDSSPLIAYQALDYLRAFYSNRIAWSRLEFMLCAIGAFRCGGDLLEELHGWSRDHLRGHRAHVPRDEVLRDQKRPYRVVCLPDRVGVTEGRIPCASWSRSASAGSA
jgi:cellulose synthase/poly-beta-1,6-N-acetylglucosamine synthase-like glycosyltransferase